MKVLIDAQLPYSLKLFLVKKGVDAKHAFDLKDKDKTSDKHIAATADNEDRIAITKDEDFVYSYIMQNKPG